MNVKNVEKENGSAKVTVEIAKDEFQTALDKAYAKIRKDIMIPGFRKGKAPRKFVERMYGSQVFYEDAVNEIFPDIYEAAIVKQELKAVGQPSVTDMQTPEDGSVVLTVSTELYPEVTLGEYKGIEVPKETVSISKAEVDAELARMQERNARIETVDREAKTGDTVVLDFEGFVDGKPFDGGKAEGYTLTLGSGAFIPGFEDQLVGLKAGDEKDVVVTFPENYTPELAGKPVVFHVKVNEVKHKEVPAIDDEFAKDVSEFDTLDELKAETRKKLVEDREAAAQRAFEDALMQKVADGIQADIPDEMVDVQAQQMMENFQQQLAAQGIPFDQYLKMTNTTEDDFKKQAHEPALQQVRMDLAVAALVKAEELEATAEEIEAEMKSVADKYGMDLDTIKKYLPEADVREQVLRSKAIKAVADAAVAVAPVVEETKEEAKQEAEKKDEE